LLIQVATQLKTVYRRDKPVDNPIQNLLLLFRLSDLLLPLSARIPLLLAATWLVLASSQSEALAGSATWNLNPTNEDWNTAANWTPMTVPAQPSDIAADADAG